MNMKRIKRFLTTIAVVAGLVALADAAVAAAKADHRDGKQLLGENIKTNGNHVIQKKGTNTVSAEVKDGKIAGVHVKNAKNGDVPVKKYKTNKNMTQAAGHQLASFRSSQDQYIGTVWIGYSYFDDYGVETIYWFPYDMILDGITGAVDYVPAY